jgi:D-sedoheptulose 7-phosphate isomerase
MVTVTKHGREGMQYAKDYLAALKQAIVGLDTGAIEQAIDWVKETRDSDRTIYVCGNGGSASIGSHFLVDLLKGGSYGRERRFKMICLSDSIATITAYANDVSYESVFVEQLRNFAGPGDLLLAISGSGNSPNVLRAVEYANGVGCRTVGLTKAGGGRLREISQLTLGVPASHMGRLEDGFTILMHIITYAFMEGVK